MVVDGIGTLWLYEKHIEETLGHTNMPVITNKYDPVYKKRRYELVDQPKKQQNRRFLHSDLALKVIIDRITDESCNFKRNLGFILHNVISSKEQTVLKDAFEGEDMQTQCSVLGYRIDLYFHKHKLMDWDMLTEVFVMKLKDKKCYKKNLILFVLELIQIKKISTSSKK